MKTIAHYLSDIRIDLKDSGALWSDPELTRCIERAVGDYSRFLPRKLSREITVDYEVTGESFTSPTAEDIDYFVTSADISASTDGTTLTVATQKPDAPRPVQITVTDANASITQLVVIVKGYDDDNKYIEEVFYLEGGLVQTGQLYFALVTEVELDEIAGNGAGDTIIVGTSSEFGIFIKLANKPIKQGTVAIADKKLDVDFEMEFSAGRISIKSGGALVASTAYTIAYTRSRIDVDLSTIIDDFISVERVEYPAGQVPQVHDTPEVWGNILTLTGGHETQDEMSDAEHVVIRYLAPHSPPDAQSSGSYPSFHDFIVQLAASAYALFMKALQYEHQSVTDLASVRTELGRAAVIVTASTGKIDLALTKVALYLETNGTTDNAKDVLGNITGDIAEMRTKIQVAQDAAAAALTMSFSDHGTHMATGATAATAAATQLAAAATALAKINDDSTRVYITDADSALDKAVLALAKINNDSGKTYLTDADTALDAAVTALVKVATYLENNTSEDSKFWLTKITADIADLRTKINTALDLSNTGLDLIETNNIELATYGSKALITSGEPKIDAINDGARVAENYAAMASVQGEIGNVRLAAAVSSVQEANARLTNLGTYIAQAGGWGLVAQGFVSEANARIQEALARIAIPDRYIAEAQAEIAEAHARLAIADRYIAEAAGRNSSGQGYVAEAQARVALANQIILRESTRLQSGLGFLQEAGSRLDNLRSHIEEAGAWNRMGETFIAEAQTWINEVNAITLEAQQYQATAQADLQLATVFKNEGIERRNEAWAIWANPNMMGATYVLGQRGQVVSP